jgi:hypothetical protein
MTLFEIGIKVKNLIIKLGNPWAKLKLLENLKTKFDFFLA